MPKFEGKRILVTGACGTVGAELINQLADRDLYSPEEIIGLDNNESELFFSDQKFLNDNRIKYFVADIRDRDELQRRFQGVDIVFHTAALKHVILCERSPDQAVQTNILGIQNVISAAQACAIEKVIFTSSDKAVNPTNVMGTSKLMGERLMTAANSCKRDGGPVFASTRFGNVLGSSGSVIPIFHNQISAGGPLTLTHEDMTRFIMSLEASVKLVIDSCLIARGGEVFITKMPVIKIKDLADAMISELATQYGYVPSDIKVEVIGTKPGEKLYEELMSDEETRRAIELEDYFAVLPAFRGIYQEIDYDFPKIIRRSVTNPYVSAQEKSLDKEQIVSLLYKYGLFGKPGTNVQQRYWPGDKEEQK